MKQLGLTKLATFGEVLSGRDLGRKAADAVQKSCGSGGVVISFAGVVIATPSFLDEVVKRLVGILQGNETTAVVLADLDDEIRHSLILVLEHRHLQLAELRDQQVELLGGTEQLADTLRAAQELGTFTAGDLAKKLELKLPNLHQRLSALIAAGALTREPDTRATRGRKHVYHAPAAKELDSAKVLIPA